MLISDWSSDVFSSDLRARNNLAAMEVGDRAFFYHSREGLEIVGICEVSVAGISDPTDSTGKWAAVKVKPLIRLPRPVTLAQIKAEQIGRASFREGACK